MSSSATAPAATRDVSARVVGMIFSYVERALGADGLAAMLNDAGFADDVVKDTTRWYTFAETTRLHDAAAAACGEADLGRRCGEELFRQVVEIGLADVFIATGSVGAACQSVAEYGSRMSDERPLWVQEVAEDHVVIQSRVDEPGVHAFFCGVTSGFYAAVPSFFGQAGVIAEIECQRRGAPQCTHLLSWRPIPSALGSTPGEAIESSPDLFATLADRLEQLQNAAADIVRAEDVDGVLDRITHHVSAALDAPRYLIAARLHDGERLRVRHRGIRADAVDAAMARLGSDDSDDDGTVVVEVTSGRRTFGRLAAFFGGGTSVRPSDRRLLEAYAGHAAAALEVISSLQEARRDRDTAQALLDLAGALAQVRTVDEIGVRLSEASSAVVEADVASVWLLDRASGNLVRRGWHDQNHDGPSALTRIDASAVPELTEMTEQPRPVLFDAADAPRVLRDELCAYGLAQVAVAPITIRGTFRGVVAASFRERRLDDRADDILVRLRGLAGHAATALENAELLERAQHEALHDQLTGLPNRPMVEDRGRQAFAQSERSGKGVGLLFVDLDRFKNVNDTLGHRAGDDLIRQVAQRMQAEMRASDVLARLGGDEFVVLLPELEHGVDDAIAVAERMIETLNGAFHVAGHELFISCSIGIACSPEHGTDYESLMQHGDAAMYVAKASGRGAFAVHAGADDAPNRQKLELESQLHRAIDNGELRVLYQPQLDVETGRIVGVEALVRWAHPDLGLLVPAAFLSLAEESGLVVALDAWVRREAFAQVKRWHDEGHDLRVAINLSSRALCNPSLAEVIGAEMAAAGVPADLVELEITDRVVMDEQELPIALDRLKELGVRLAIDDFGTGSSVLGRLQSCPVDTLKIDRSFVQAVTVDCPEAPLVKAMVALAHTLDMAVVAEGVETDEQDEALRRYGCELVQGFLFSRPVPAAEIEALLALEAPAALVTP